MKKIKGVKGVIRAIGSACQSSKSELDFEENLKSEHFNIAKIVRHGFPASPSCIAFDPIQKLLAIGTKHGSIRILGRAGVDCHIKLENEEAVKELLFIINEGKLVSFGCDNTVNLWTLGQKKPEIVQQMTFNKREDVTCAYLPFQSNYLYIGTNKGNVYLLKMDTFTLSGYIINWNKVIGAMQGSHPGSVIHMSECPMDSTKLLLGFSQGLISLWDLKTKEATRFKHSEELCSLSWHYEGRSFVSSHIDGSLLKWSVKAPQKPLEIVFPHANLLENPDATAAFRRIPRVCWLSNKKGEDLFLFSGGSPLEISQPCVNLLVGRHIDVLQMEHTIIDIVPLCETPYKNDVAEPYAVAVLQQNDLVVIDLTSEGYPNFENPYPMDLHEASVTSCFYLADCPPNLIRDYYSIGRSLKREEGFSTKQWPVTGGEWGDTKTSYPEILITGHSDGSLKFWDASLLELQVLYRVKTSRYFDIPTEGGVQKSSRQVSTDSRDGAEALPSSARILPAALNDEEPFAIHHISFDSDYQRLIVAGNTHVCVLNFNKKEITTDITTLDLSIEPSSDDSEVTEDFSRVASHPNFLPPQRESVGSPQFSCSPVDKDLSVCVAVRAGSHRWAPGFQPELIVRLGTTNADPPSSITSARFHPPYQLLAIGNDCGIAIVDTAQTCVLLSMCTQDLYGSMDPYLKNPRSPTSKKEDRNSSSDQSHGVQPAQPDVGGAQTVRAPPPRPPLPQKVSRTKTELLAAQKKCKLHPKSISVSLPHPNHPVFGSLESLKESQSLLEENNNIELAMRDGPAFVHIERRPVSSIELAQEAIDVEVLDKVQDAETATATNTAMPRKARARAASVPHIMDILDLRDDDLPPRKHAPARAKLPKSHSKPRGEFLSFSFQVNGVCMPNATQGSSGNLNRRSDRRPDNAGVISARGELKRTRSQDKPDSLTSRSCSSSTSSLENANKESISFLAYSDSFLRKNDTVPTPSLWIGTTQGSVMIINLQISFDSRTTQPVICAPSCTMFRLMGSIKNIAFLDSIVPPPPPTPVSESPNSSDPSTPRKQLGKSSSSSSTMSRQNTTASMSESKSESLFTDNQLICLCSEKQVRVVGLPSQIVYAKKKLTETSAVIRADVPQVNGSPCLICYLANGHVIVNSLPSLRPLMDVDYLPYVDFSSFLERDNYIHRIAKTFQFSNHGHAIYFCSPSELQKMTLSSEMSNHLTDMLADLHITCQLPEAPKKNFFDKIGSNFFGAGETDREQLFGEGAVGKASAGIAKQTKGPDLNRLQAKAEGASSEISNALKLGLERGEKLNQVDDQTERMRDAAEQNKTVSNALLQKYKNKKFWQF